MTEPRDWIGRVRQADAEAEKSFDAACLVPEMQTGQAIAAALLVIAAELRAQRISRRPGAGMKPSHPPADPSNRSV
jgi:hypothetical protein